MNILATKKSHCDDQYVAPYEMKWNAGKENKSNTNNTFKRRETLMRVLER